MKKIFCYGKKNEKGITLTALVITVVVLSAIAAVGLKAADSEIKSVNGIQNEAQKQEDKLENTGKQINKMYDDLDIKDVDLTAEIKQTTCSFEISNVQLQNSSEMIGRYKYFIKEKDSSSYREISSTKDNFMTMDKLRHNTQYDIKIEVYNQSGKKIKTSVKTAKTNELTAGSLILKLKDNAGAEYTPGTWTASDVYVRQVEGNAGKTTYQTVGSSAQTIAQGTSGETIVSKSGVTTIRVITTDGTNTVNGKDYVIKIDKEAPISGALKMQLDNNNGAEYKNDTWTKHDIYVSLQQGNSNLSGIKSTVYNVTGAESHTNQTQPLTLKTTGTYTINVITTNNVGTTSTKTYTVKIDKDVPEAGKLTMKLDSASGENYTNDTWTNHNIYIAVNNGNDANSGHQSTTYSISGPITVTNSSAARTLTAEGTYTVVLTTKDMAGNTATRTYTIKTRYPKVGEYVKYNPNTPSSSYSLTTNYSGHTIRQLISSSYDPVAWRVMEVDSTGRITKIFGVPTSNRRYKVYFGGSVGYNNGVYLLNDICKERYSNSSFNAIARSINENDIISQMTEEGLQSLINSTENYGTTTVCATHLYPKIYSQEQYSGVNVSGISDGTQIITSNADLNAREKMNPNGKKASDSIYSYPTTEKYNSNATSLTIVDTILYGENGLLSSYFKDSNFYDIICGTGTNYWIASRYTKAIDKTANFGILGMSGNQQTGALFYYSTGNTMLSCYHLAPVIDITNGIHASGGQGTATNPYTLEAE